MGRNNIFDELNNIHWEMESLFHSLFNPRYPMHLISDRKWRPLTDMYELNGECIIKVELPGVVKEDISLTLEGKQLVIRGTRSNPNQNSNMVYHQMEINYGEFERILILPHAISEEHIKAELKEGFLFIKINIPDNKDKKTEGK